VIGTLVSIVNIALIVIAIAQMCFSEKGTPNSYIIRRYRDFCGGMEISNYQSFGSLLHISDLDSDFYNLQSNTNVTKWKSNNL